MLSDRSKSRSHIVLRLLAYPFKIQISRFKKTLKTRFLEGICKRNIKEKDKIKLRRETRKKQNPKKSRKEYPKDLTDRQWEIIKDMFPAAKSDIAQGRKRPTNL